MIIVCDERGVTPLLGFTLMFAVLMVSLSVLQAEYIPEICKKVEADHMRKLTGQVIELKNIPSNTKAVNFDMGVDYPEAMFLLTPESVPTTISVNQFNVSVEYTEVLSNGAKLEKKRNFSSGMIRILPNYLFYPKSEIVIDSTAMFKQSGDEIVTLSDQTAFADEINFVILNTTFKSISTAQPISFISDPTSTGGGILVENLSISFESYNPEYWLTLKSYNVTLHDKRVIVHREERILFTLNCITLSYGSELKNSNPVPSRILKINSLDNFSLKAGEAITLGARIFDEYNNPVENVKVTVNSTMGAVNPSILYTDKDGEVYTTFTAGDISSIGKVTFKCTECSEVNSVNYRISVISTSEECNPLSLVLYSQPDAEIDGFSAKTVSAILTSRGEPLPGFEIDFATNSSNAIVNPSNNITDYLGGVSATVMQAAMGKNWYRVYGYAGCAVDYIDVLLNTTATWWNTSWRYRVPVYISGFATDYQIKVVIDTKTLVSEGKMQEDCDDIRFVDLDDNELSYWIEDGINTERTVIWVRIPAVQANTAIYMYYGNPEVEGASNGNETFIFFDNFESFFDWSVYGNTPTIVTYEGRKCLRMKGMSEIVHSVTDIPVNGYALITLSKLTTPEYMEAYMSFFGFGSSERSGDEDNAYQFGYNVYRCGPRNYEDNIRIFENKKTMAERHGDREHIRRDGWARLETTVYNGVITLTVEETSRGKQTISILDAGYWTDTAPLEVGIIVWNVPGPFARTTYMTDWVLVRKYTDPEPAVTTGIEEIFM